ncbi:hypothetical protein LLG96_11995 [bacterium]|nr:hypothetical protein [bacterium]
MSGKKQKKEIPVNENWEAEIAAYDEECRCMDQEFYDKNIIITQAGNNNLTVEENEVMNLFLNGVTCDDIAKQYEVEVEVVTGLLEIIRAKLSLPE